MLDAYNQVKANNGSAGIDGITIDQIDDYLRQHWRSTKELIKQRKYKPQPVLRVEIPKPNGGVRQLGIPTVMDRMIQQAIVQVISYLCEPYFFEMSYGFRFTGLVAYFCVGNYRKEVGLIDDHGN